MSYGTVNNGLVLYIGFDGHLVYDHNAYTSHTVIRSAAPLPAGSLEVGLNNRRVRGGPAKAELVVTGIVVGVGNIAVVPNMISPVGVDIGRNLSGVSDAYTPPYNFTGSIRRVVIDTQPAMSAQDEFAIALAAALATQ